MTHDSGPSGGREGPAAGGDRPAGERANTLDDRLPGTLRLRSAGVGAVLGGIGLATVTLVVGYVTAAALLVGGALVAGVLAWGDQALLQTCLGVGAVGVIGLLEAGTTLGPGLGPAELAGLAVVFGFIDIFLGGMLYRMRPDVE